MGVGWYDFTKRTYDPQLGRFWQSDPLAEQMRRWSTYAYCFDNPMRFIDPDGMKPHDPPYFQIFTPEHVEKYGPSAGKAAVIGTAGLVVGAAAYLTAPITVPLLASAASTVTSAASTVTNAVSVGYLAATEYVGTNTLAAVTTGVAHSVVSGAVGSDDPLALPLQNPAAAAVSDFVSVLTQVATETVEYYSNSTGTPGSSDLKKPETAQADATKVVSNTNVVNVNNATPLDQKVIEQYFPSK